MLKLQLIGRLSADAQVKESNGKKYLIFSAYHSRKIKENDYKSTFINCIYFSEKAESYAQWLTKGKAVFIEGEPTARGYVDKDNKPQGSLDVNVRTIEFVQGDRQADTNTPQQSVPAPQAVQQEIVPPPADDLPF